MSFLKQREANNNNEIRLLFTVKRIADIFLFLFGILIVVGLFMFFYSYYIQEEMIYRTFIWPRPRMTLWETWLVSDVYQSMIVSGIIGMIISTPITIMLSIRLKGRQSAYIKQEYRHNTNFIKLQRKQHKIVTPPKWS